MLYLAVLRTEKRTVITSRKHAAGHRYWPMQCDGRRLQNGYHWLQEKEKTFHTQITIQHSGLSSWSRLVEVSYGPDEDSDLLGRNGGRGRVP